MAATRLNLAGRLGILAMETHLTPIFSLLIFLVGMVALFTTPREENPQIDVPAANVYVRMHGASTEEVMNLVVRPLEMVMREMTGVDHTFGMAQDSLGVVTVQFEVGEDKEKSLVKLYDRLMHNLDRIPPGASEPLVKPLDVDDVPVVVVTLASVHYDGLTLKRLAERVKEQLVPIPGVSVADIIGGRDHEISIRLDPTRLAAYHIPLDRLHQTLASANAGGPAGELVGGNAVSRVWLAGFLENAEEVGRLIVGQWQGRPVHLRDVASIGDGPAEVQALHRIGFGSASGHFDAATEPEHEAVSILLAKKRGSNAVVVAKQIRAKLTGLTGDLIPADVTVAVTRDSGERADAAVNMLIEHLGIAIASVILILLAFLGWREAAIVTLNIPLILFIVLAVGMVFGQTINRITLFALILSLGLLVDDAIVVIENIHRHLRQGVSRLSDKASAIIAATNETGRPTIIATIAVILAFIPMAFVTGMMGPYMGPIPFNAPIAMAASLVIAYMLTPWIARRWLPCRIKEATRTEQDESPKDWVHRTYLRLATPLIEKPWPRLGLAVAVLLLFAFAMWQPAWQFLRPAGIGGPLTPGTVALKMLPKGNKNTFNVTIDMPEGTPLEGTDAVAREVADVLRQHPMVTDYEAFVGQAGPIDFNGMLKGAVFRQGPHLAEIRVNLVDKRQRSETSEEIVLALRHMLKPVRTRHAKANIKLVEDPPGPPVRATLLAEIYGPDYSRLRQLAEGVRSIFASTYDVVDADDSVGADAREFRVHVDKGKAARLGIATAQVQQALTDYLAGFDLGAVHLASERHPVRIRVRVPRSMRVTPADLERIYVSGTNNTPVQLASIAEVQGAIADKPMFSKDGHPVAYVTGEPEQGSQVYALLDMDQRLDGSQPVGDVPITTAGMHFVRSQPQDTFAYQLLWDGEMRLTLDVFRDLGAAFIVALVLIYLLLVAYYGTFTLPLLVMGAIPMTMIGIFPGHLITGQPFTATSMIGMITLAGVVVRNSLLLIDFTLDYRAQGHDLKAAVLEAGAVRARPILLTALAVIAGTSIMISDPVFGGLGVSMAFGAFASTLLTLFIIPLIYFLWQRNKPTTANPSAMPVKQGENT